MGIDQQLGGCSGAELKENSEVKPKQYPVGGTPLRCRAGRKALRRMPSDMERAEGTTPDAGRAARLSRAQVRDGGAR